MKLFLSAFIFLFLLTSCVDDPLEGIKKELSPFDEYSVVLKDMREENDFPQFQHRYQIVALRHPPEFSETMKEAVGGEEKAFAELKKYETDWLPVPEKVYQKHRDHLGMTILSKAKGGKPSDISEPPGYQYVGNPNYGHWVQRNGGSFWEFYGKYRLFRDLFGGFGGTINRNDYDSYKNYRRRGLPYYGRKNQWGTNGSVAKRTSPGFFERRRVKEARRKSNFSSRFNNRVSRSRSSGFRSRSSGFGK